MPSDRDPSRRQTQGSQGSQGSQGYGYVPTQPGRRRDEPPEPWRDAQNPGGRQGYTGTASSGAEHTEPDLYTQQLAQMARQAAQQVGNMADDVTYGLAPQAYHWDPVRRQNVASQPAYSQISAGQQPSGPYQTTQGQLYPTGSPGSGYPGQGYGQYPQYPPRQQTQQTQQGGMQPYTQTTTSAMQSQAADTVVIPQYVNGTWVGSQRMSRAEAHRLGYRV